MFGVFCAALAAYAQLSIDETRRQRDAAVAEPFTGIITSAGRIENLFPIASTGVSTAPVRQAAAAFLATLSPEERAETLFPVDADEWRRWTNVDNYRMNDRQGISFEQMTDAQREAAFALMQASLSARGMKLSRDIMRLNETLAEIAQNFDRLGEWLYWITVMGEPSATEPWGWQIDGHHLVINYFVLGDQVVMTPRFVGSEPTIATTGKYKGTAVLQEEQDDGLAMIRSLTPEQRKVAVIKTGSKDRDEALLGAYRDNLLLDYAGLPATELTDEQQARLQRLIALWVSQMDDGHAKVRMSEVERYLDQTYFAWIGDTGDDSVFYYRIHSPVIVIEFDHTHPIFLDRSSVPIRQHIHAMVRTPNGNDYGRDLLRQHYEQYTH